MISYFPEMLIFGAQIASNWEDPEKSLAKAEPLVKEAARLGGSLVCFPEQFATGWDPSSHMHLQGRDGPIVSRLGALASEYGIAVLGSFREMHDPLPRNTCIVLDRNGEEMASYSKCHLFSPAGEDRNYTHGNSPAIFDLEGNTLGIAICYDLRFSSLFRIYADAGVVGVLVPAAWPGSRSDHWELFIRARALEGQMYVVGVNTTGCTPVDSYAGGSMTADPGGQIICRLGEDDGLMKASIDRNAVEDARSCIPVSRDRRTDLSRYII
ncbi:MAG TPA: nitrilase-related carbon-nitrogen hydrolase [Methanoregulaceae archaeon]|nr:nitrilase-related carbon-nitrogen hydrolase [Methanoregulaceae archaeon]